MEKRHKSAWMWFGVLLGVTAWLPAVACDLFQKAHIPLGTGISVLFVVAWVSGIRLWRQMPAEVSRLSVLLLLRALLVTCWALTAIATGVIAGANLWDIITLGKGQIAAIHACHIVGIVGLSIGLRQTAQPPLRQTSPE